MQWAPDGAQQEIPAGKEVDVVVELEVELELGMLC